MVFTSQDAVMILETTCGTAVTAVAHSSHQIPKLNAFINPEVTWVVATQICFIFNPIPRGKVSHFDLRMHIFQMG